LLTVPSKSKNASSMTTSVAQGDSLAVVGWLVKCYYRVQQ
jgi:hypothetical protein